MMKSTLSCLGAEWDKTAESLSAQGKAPLRLHSHLRVRARHNSRLGCREGRDLTPKGCCDTHGKNPASFRNEGRIRRHLFRGRRVRWDYWMSKWENLPYLSPKPIDCSKRKENKQANRSRGGKCRISNNIWEQVSMLFLFLSASSKAPGIPESFLSPLLGSSSLISGTEAMYGFYGMVFFFYVLPFFDRLLVHNN